MKPLLGCSTVAVALGLVFAPRPALAQVNADVGVSGGIMKRFTTGADQGVSDPGFGPVFQLQGHLAVLPMLRVGLYAAYDSSPMPHAGARNFVTGGLHVKFTPPLLPTPWKLYFFTGFGGGYAEADSYTGATFLASPGPYTAKFSKIDGGLLEIPLGIGVARKVSGPFEVFAELGGRFGVAFFGNIYDSQNGDATANLPNLPVAAAHFTGIDSFALSLTVGVSLTD